MVVKNYVEKYRKAKKLTQTDLSNLTGLSKNSISKIERCDSCPSVFTAFLIADALEVDISDLFFAIPGSIYRNSYIKGEVDESISL